MLQQILKIIWKHRGQNLLLLLELFISFIVLAGAFAYLLFNRAQFTSPLGFETKNRLAILFTDLYSEIDSASYTQKIKGLELSLRNMPEVESFSFGNSIYPFSFNTWQSNSETNNVRIEYNQASMDERYSETMGITMVAGRWLAQPQDKNALEEVVVNQRFIDKNFGGKPMLDSIINLNGDVRIVGVMQHFKYNGEFTDEPPMVINYQNPYNQEEASTLYIRLKPNTPVVIEEELSKLIMQTTGIKDFIMRNLDDDRREGSKATWVNLYAVTALTLFLVINVAMGLFGVLLYNINKRRGEISLRKALGATNTAIMVQFGAEMMGLALVAIVLGCLVFWQMAWYGLIDFVEKTMMYTGMWYAVTFVALLVLVCSAYPVWRAARLHPATGLREE
jgi:putative ABC transport system permease protein